MILFFHQVVLTCFGSWYPLRLLMSSCIFTWNQKEIKYIQDTQYKDFYITGTTDNSLFWLWICQYERLSDESLQPAVFLEGDYWFYNSNLKNRLLFCVTGNTWWHGLRLIQKVKETKQTVCSSLTIVILLITWRVAFEEIAREVCDASGDSW